MAKQWQSVYKNSSDTGFFVSMCFYQAKIAGDHFCDRIKRLKKRFYICVLKLNSVFNKILNISTCKISQKNEFQSDLGPMCF
jgi:hypothetical protein